MLTCWHIFCTPGYSTAEKQCFLVIICISNTESVGSIKPHLELVLPFLSMVVLRLHREQRPRQNVPIGGQRPFQGESGRGGKLGGAGDAAARPLCSQGTTCLCPPVPSQAPEGPRPASTYQSGILLLEQSLRQNLVKMQFRDLLCVEPVHHGRGLGGLGSLRSQFMETEAFQVRLV